MPIFLAAYYSFTFYNEHNISVTNLDFNYNNTDTISVQGDLSLYKLADAIGLPFEDVETLNPRFKKGYIPNKNKSYSLVLPSYKISDYLLYANEVKNISDKDVEERNASADPSNKVIHTVKYGEYFHKIAINYGCTIQNIIDWNNLDSSKVHPGQQLVIYTN